MRKAKGARKKHPHPRTHCRRGHDLTKPGARTAPSKHHLYGRCRACRRNYAGIYARARQQSDPAYREKHRLRSARWRAANREWHREYCKSWRRKQAFLFGPSAAVQFWGRQILNAE